MINFCVLVLFELDACFALRLLCELLREGPAVQAVMRLQPLSQKQRCIGFFLESGYPLLNEFSRVIFCNHKLYLQFVIGY